MNIFVFGSATLRDFLGNCAIRRAVLVSVALVGTINVALSGKSAGKREEIGVEATPAFVVPGEKQSTQDTFGSMSAGQQQAIGLKIAFAQEVQRAPETSSPGRIAPDPSRFAFITPRAAGVIREVHVNIGQNVVFGQPLATIDSPDVGQVRLELVTQSQRLDIAREECRWQEMAQANVEELLAALRTGAEPQAIEKKLEGRPIGPVRERLMTAYSHFRMAAAALRRQSGLAEETVVSQGQFQQTRATCESATGAYNALMDSAGYEANLATMRARQSVRLAETALLVSRERLKLLGIDPDVKSATASLSAYTVVAPFNGTVLEREAMAPGVPVDPQRRLFTIADLSTIAIEVNAPEGSLTVLAQSQEGSVQFSTPAYPDREFVGKVLYTGDVVDPASCAVRLLAIAPNGDRWLKPGMFVNAVIRSPQTEPAFVVPASAVVSEGERSFVYVALGSDQFGQREVVVGKTVGNQATIVHGLNRQDRIVVEGAAKVRAMIAGADRGELAIGELPCSVLWSGSR